MVQGGAEPLHCTPLGGFCGSSCSDRPPTCGGCVECAEAGEQPADALPGARRYDAATGAATAGMWEGGRLLALFVCWGWAGGEVRF